MTLFSSGNSALKQHDRSGRWQFSAATGSSVERLTMSEHSYRLVEVVGSSPDGIDQAIKNAIEDTSKTVRNIHWFEVVETRGHVEEGKIKHFQVTLKIGFTLDDR